MKISGHPFAVRRAAPARGEHNGAILAALGCSPAEISRYAADGAFG
jgi:crotonobetainyl-CoA:carnitine CoA-transferase CaiB-like acyl-CoA transferase